MKCPVDIESLYSDYIDAKNEENFKERYEGRESYYHASGAGSCSRKLYFETIERPDVLDNLNDNSKRLLRLGTIVHNDFETCLRTLQEKKTIYKEKKKDESSDTIYSNTIDSSIIYNNTIYSKEKEILYFQKESFDFYVEKEISLPDLNVRGFYDLVCVSDKDGAVYLIDFKTIGAYPWSRKFGYKHKDMNPPIHQEVQLATYGLYIQKEFGRLDGMYLYFYNKDNSKMKPVEVPLNMLKRAENFWRNVNEEHKKGLPPFREGVSPVQDWNCSYCPYLDHCNPPNRKRR